LDGGSQNFAVDAAEIPEVIADGTAFDPRMQSRSAERVAIEVACADFAEWPIATTEQMALDDLLRDWRVAGCLRVQLVAGTDHSILVESLVGDHTGRVRVFASPSKAADIDLLAIDAAAVLVDEDTRKNAWADVEIQPQHVNGRIVVQNKDSQDADVLLLFFYPRG
jgi:hypothetical protein